MVKSMPLVNGESAELPAAAEGDDGSMDFVVLNNPYETDGIVMSSLKDICTEPPLMSEYVSSLELQAKIKELVEENTLWKEQLAAQTVELRKQIQNFTLYKENVERIDTEQRQIISEAKSHIQELKAERDVLTNGEEKLKRDLKSAQEEIKQLKISEAKVDELANQISNLEKEKISLEEMLDKESKMKLQMAQNIEDITKELREMKNKIDTLMEENKELNASNAKLTSQLAELMKKEDVEESFVITQLPETQTSNSQSTSTGEAEQPSLSQGTQDVKDVLLSLHKEQDKVQSLTKHLSEEQLQVNRLQKELDNRTKAVISLKEQVEILKSPCSNAELSDERVGNLLKEKGGDLLKAIKLTMKKFEMTNTFLQTYKDRCDSFGNCLAAYEEFMRNASYKDKSGVKELEAKIAEMQMLLQEERASKQEDRRNLHEARKQFEELFNDYQNLQRLWAAFQAEQKEKNQNIEALGEIAERKHQETVDFLTATKLKLEEDIEARDQAIKELTEKLETLPILKEQVEVFQQNFKEEENLRLDAEKKIESLTKHMEKLTTEKQQLAGMLYYLQNCTESREGATPLVLEGSHSWESALTSRASSSDSVGAQANAADGSLTTASSNPNSLSMQSHRQASQIDEETETGGPYTCPKCELVFTQLQAAMNHVNRCIDDHSLFP